jgi:zinc protease
LILRRVVVIAAVALIAAGQTAPRAATATPLSSYKNLKYPPLPPIKIPDVKTSTLPNGMKLYLLEDHELPVVSGVALVRTGNLFDPKGKVGLATMTGIVLRAGGTQTKSGDQLDQELENVAASVESSVGETSGQVSFSALKENTAEVLGVFKELLTAPAFRQDKLELAKTQLRSSIARRNDDAGGIASREFADTVYGKDTPYGWRMEIADVNAVQREDLVGFYRRYFFPANIMLGIRGDFSAAEMQARVEQLFASWNAQQPPVPPFPPVQNQPKPGIRFAEKEDVTQTFFEMGHFGGTFRDKDYPALAVMSDILGGGFRSRLFQRIRTALGYAYNIGADWGATYDHPGLLEISGSTKSASTVDTIQAVQQEIEKIRTTEVTAEELETAKQTVQNSFVFNFDTKAKTLSRLLTYEYYGYPRDFIYQYQKAVAAVTRADVLRVAREHVHPDQMVVVVVGKQSEFGKPLATLKLPVTSIDLSIPGINQASQP